MEEMNKVFIFKRCESGFHIFYYYVYNTHTMVCASE